MVYYVDSSWLLGTIFQRAKKSLASSAIIHSSILIHVECRRVLDRQLKRGLIDENIFEKANVLLNGYMERFNIIGLDTEIITRAAEAFFVPLHSLDALHLATAMKLNSTLTEKLTFLTEDTELATAARAHGFTVA